MSGEDTRSEPRPGDTHANNAEHAGHAIRAERGGEPLLTLKRVSPGAYAPSPGASGSKSPPGGDPGEEPAHRAPPEESFSEIRERVLARRRERLAAARRADSEAGIETDSDLSDEESDEDEVTREAYSEFRKAKQVDLNEEENAAKLEDPALRGHMESARAGLKRHEAALSRLPALESLRKQHLRIMQRLTALNAMIEEEVLMASREQGEMAHYQAKALGLVRAGKVPHGYPGPVSPETKRDPNFLAALKKAKEGASSAAAAHDGAVVRIEAAQKEIFLLRREIDAVCDGVIRLYEAGEEVRRRQREVLRLVDGERAAEVNRKAPAGLALSPQELLPPSVRGVTSGAGSGAAAPADGGKGKEKEELLSC